MDTQDGGWKEGGRVHFYFLGIRAQLFTSGFYLRRSLQFNVSTSEPIPSPLSPKVYRAIALLFILKAVLMAGDKICFYAFSKREILHIGLQRRNNYGESWLHQDIRRGRVRVVRSQDYSRACKSWNLNCLPFVCASLLYLI